MTKEYYEEEFKNGSLIDCKAVNLKYIAFIHKDEAQTEASYEEVRDGVLLSLDP